MTDAESKTVDAVTAALTMPPAVFEALQHVRSMFPRVDRVIYDVHGLWTYQTPEGYAPAFHTGIDVNLLNEASAAAMPGKTYSLA